MTAAEWVAVGIAAAVAWTGVVVLAAMAMSSERKQRHEAMKVQARLTACERCGRGSAIKVVATETTRTAICRWVEKGLCDDPGVTVPRRAVEQIVRDLRAAVSPDQPEHDGHAARLNGMLADCPGCAAVSHDHGQADSEGGAS